MAKAKIIQEHVVPLGKGWAVKRSNAKTFFIITGTKIEALTVARTLAKTNKGVLVIHGRDGAIQESKRYVTGALPPKKVAKRAAVNA